MEKEVPLFEIYRAAESTSAASINNSDNMEDEDIIDLVGESGDENEYVCCWNSGDAES